MKRKVRKITQRQKFHQERREVKRKEKMKDELEDFYWEYTKSPYAIASHNSNYLYALVSIYYYYCFRPPIDIAFLYNCSTGELRYARIHPVFKELGVAQQQWFDVEAMLNYDLYTKIEPGDRCYSIHIINGNETHYLAFNAVETINNHSIKELVLQFNIICEEQDYFGLGYLYG